MDNNQPYIVSARKYRPATFRSVVGQRNLTNTLKNAIDSQRLAQAYLFCGPRGVGKTSCARIFAKTINCLSPTADGEACGCCDSCRAIEQGNSFNIIELDAASNNSVDDIRQITEQVNIAPQAGKYRVFIIDEVHMLSSAAFNAFLKTLEEPPKYVIFILATTEKHKVIPTILSRCQIYDFKRITIGDMSEHLQYVASQEGIEAEPKALDVIARKADGAMRDALSIFDQVTASSGGRITYKSAINSLNVLDYDYYFKLVDAFKTHDVVTALLIFKEIRDKGFDSQFFINGLAAHVRDLMVAASPASVGLLEVSKDVAQQYMEQAQTLPLSWYYEAINLLNRCDLEYRTVTDKRLHVELCLINLCRIGSRAPAPQAGNTAPQQPKPQTQTQPAAPPTPRPAPQGAPQGAQRPAPQPAATRPAARPLTQSQRPPQSFRLSGQQPSAPQPEDKPSEEKPPAAQQPEQTQPKNIEATALASAWEQFIAENPHKQLLLSVMRLSKPQITGVADLTVTVDSDASRDLLEGELANLLPYLRSKLANPSVKINIAIDTTVARRKVLTPKEYLTEVASNNSVMRNLLKGLDFEFA